MSLSTNVGKIDRALRIIAGAILVAMPIVFAGPMWDGALLRIGVPLVGLVLIITAIVRFCPLYRLFGANTCRSARS